MELSARLFGVNAWSILVPQALEGVATVALLYAAVKRWFGPAAGLLAGAVMALTPVATLMFRFNNPDALLVLLLTLGAWATLKAVDAARTPAGTRWLLAAAAFVGFGFLHKNLPDLHVVEIGGRIAWLLPAALVALGVGLYLAGRRPRTDRGRAAFLLWGGWLVVTALVFSLMRGIFHAYYTVALAPAVAALVGMGAVVLWRRRGR